MIYVNVVDTGKPFKAGEQIRVEVLPENVGIFGLSFSSMSLGQFARIIEKRREGEWFVLDIEIVEEITLKGLLSSGISVASLILNAKVLKIGYKLPIEYFLLAGFSLLAFSYLVYRVGKG